MDKLSGLVGRSDKVVAARISMIPGTLGTIMHAIAFRLFGADIYSWEPETLHMEFVDELGVQPHESNMEKLHAIVSTVASDSFYNDWAAYVSVCSILSGENSPEEIYDLTPYELTWGCLEISLNDEDYSKSLFSPDICTITGITLDEEGIVKPPSILSFAKMPYRYDGSTYGPDINREVNQSTHALDLLSEYMRDQLVTLNKQMRNLPWLSEEEVQMALHKAKETIMLH